jgi:Ser/Thr protein kinase RdoA (MazF antagonist)
MKLPEEIITEYNIGVIHKLLPLREGIIHKTWKVETDLGIFILQKVNPIYTPLVMEDLKAVLEYLKSKGFEMTEVVETKNKHLYVEDEANFWRILTYIEGKSYGEVNNPQTACEAGKLLGFYHKSLVDFQYNFKHIRETVNNIPLLYKKYKDVVINNTNPDIEYMIPAINKMIEFKLPPYLRKTINHGDPKISNFIFTNSSPPKAITMVDFDDCGKNYNVLHELGDAFCSWSWKPQEIHNLFDLALFNTGLHGYFEGSQGFLLEEEWNFLPQALKLHLLQLISRFVRDFFEDTYFEWDSSLYTSRKEHNLARAKEYFALYEDICKKENKIIQIINRIRIH